MPVFSHFSHISHACPSQASHKSLIPLTASRYTVDYRDCWVIERMSEALPALNMGHLQNSIP